MKSIKQQGVLEVFKDLEENNSIPHREKVIIKMWMDETLAKVCEEIEEILNRDSKKIILEGIKTRGIPKEIFFTEKRFFQALDFMKEEIREKIKGEET